jgi:putative ABC transport system substrate-binding protein
VSGMRRREFITLLGGAVATWPLAARAQQPERVHRIGLLETTSRPLNAANFEAFRQALRELGHIEGRNLIIEYRSADGRSERFPELATELVRLNCDLIITRGTPAALAAKQASETIPVVMTATAEPFTLVSSLAHPDGNITRLSSLSADLFSKRLELLKELIPVLGRVAHLTDAGNPTLVRIRREIETAAQSMGIASPLLDVRKTEDIGPAFDSASNHCFACGEASAARDLRFERICRGWWADDVWRELPPTFIVAQRYTWTRYSRVPNRRSCPLSSLRNSTL